MARSIWIVCGGLLTGVLGFLWRDRTTAHTATVNLIRSEASALGSVSDTADMPRAQEYSVQTLADVMRSPELLRRVAAVAGAPTTAEELAKVSRVVPVPDTELLRLMVRGRDAREAVALATTYADQAVEFIRSLQSNEVRRAKAFIDQQLPAVDRRVEAAKRALTEFQEASGAADFEREAAGYIQQRADLDLKSESIRIELQSTELQVASLIREIAKHHPALLSAREALDQALLRYTEEHPKVKQLRATVESIEAKIGADQTQVDPEIALQGNALIQGLYSKVIELKTQKLTLAKQLEEIEGLKKQLAQRLKVLPERTFEYARLKSQFESLNNTRALLVGRQSELQFAEGNWGGLVRVLEYPQREDWEPLFKLRTGLLWAGGSAVLGGVLTGCLIMLLGARDRRIRSEEDLRRVTNLPVLAVLGNVGEMDDEARARWAFETLTRLKGRLNHCHGGLVCAFTSSRHGEGRSTWINLLAAAASRQGYRILTVFANGQRRDGQIGSGADALQRTSPDGESATVPFEVARALMAPWSRPVVDIPATDWIWNLERRKQWQEAVQKLSAVQDLVALVELPPASRPETLLLAEGFAHVIWLCGGDTADAAETRGQVEMLRHAGSRLAGAVLNRAGTPARRKRRAPLAVAGLIALASFLDPLRAEEAARQEEPEPVRPTPNGSLSVSSPDKLAEWQKRLTLGPGDVLSISIYDLPDTGRSGLAIGPDGRLNYLQARDVVASGLTVDELREKLETVLAQYYRPPIRAVVLPQAYVSKKYYLLGNTIQKGVFPLDRPTTIVEAIARARGFQSSPQQRDTFILADLSRSFLVRKLPDDTFQTLNVDFEALFLRADLSQNIQLAPNDYLYFPPLDLREVYVLGEVRAPGIVPYTPDLAVLKAIIARGGFMEKSYYRKVLVVRGSWSNPETFVVNASDILTAKAPDFPLKPRDIIYVSRRPWSRVTDLLEMAITEYARTIVIAWTGQNVGPFTKEPYIPGPKGD